VVAAAGGDEGLFRVERDGVFIGGHMGAFQAGFGSFAGNPFRPQIDQQQVAIGAAGDNGQPLINQCCR
jgi:hypothetical protein